MTDDWIQFDISAADSLAPTDASLHLLPGSGQQSGLCISDLVANPQQSDLIFGFYFPEKILSLAKFESQTQISPPPACCTCQTNTRQYRGIAYAMPRFLDGSESL